MPKLLHQSAFRTVLISLVFIKPYSQARRCDSPCGSTELVSAVKLHSFKWIQGFTLQGMEPHLVVISY